MTQDTDRMWHESPEYRQEQISAALDGMLTTDEQAALDAHLAGCDTCARELEELRQVRALLRALPQPALPRSFVLPINGELAPARATENAPVLATASSGSSRMAPANVTLMRQPGQRRRSGNRAMGTLRVTRWIGTIAAILGLALFLGTLLPTLHSNSYSAARAPINASGNSGAAATTSRPGALASTPTTDGANYGGQTLQDKAATATAAAAQAPTRASTATPTVAAVDHNFATSSGPSSADILRTIALVLLFAGAGLALLTIIIARQL